MRNGHHQRDHRQHARHGRRWEDAMRRQAQDRLEDENDGHETIEIKPKLPSAKGVKAFVAAHPISVTVAALAAGFFVGRIISRM